MGLSSVRLDLTPLRLGQQSIFHPRAPRNAFRRRDVRLQLRLFTLGDPRSLGFQLSFLSN